jgi:hypothetical protein
MANGAKQRAALTTLYRLRSRLLLTALAASLQRVRGTALRPVSAEARACMNSIVATTV